MALFQKTVIDKYLSKLNEAEVKKAFDILKIQFSASRQQRMLTTIEIGFQAEFVEKLFDKVLGYIRFDEDNWNIKREHNSETSNERADAAIIIDSDESKTLAVIELKSTKTHSLQSVEGQVFKYFRQHQPICRYAVISNFQMIRLYVDDNQGFEQFDIFEIVNNDRFDLFRLLYLYLNPQFVFQNLPAKIREGTIQKEKEITNNLYRLYSDFRFALHKELNQQNPKVDELLLFKKTQKLIDRFLFIFFAEDKGLLPTKTIQNHIKEWKKSSKISLLESFKTLFKDLKDGNKVKDIFAYNGGLFDTDSVLDSVKLDIGNSLEVYLDALQMYDFKTEVDVNILGHIFEQSLNDMDEMKALTEGKKVDKAITKRKKEGVFYTPQYITRYIVENTIGVLCSEKEQELGIIEGKEVTKKQLNAYSQWLSTVKVLDPACGSGAFLNQALSFFISQYERIDERMAGIDGKPVIYGDYDKYGDTILKNNIFGVDLNEEAVEIAKLSLWLRTAKEGKKLISLNDNIKVGNSLIDDPSVSNAAFDWEKAFSEVFKQGGFDVIIGNPPYGVAFNENEKRYIPSKYKSYKYKFESYIYFMELSLNLLKNNGLIGFITPELWLNLENCAPIREIISKQAALTEIKVLGESVFSDAVVNTIIFFLKKNTKIEKLKVIENDDEWYIPTKNWLNHPIKSIEYRNRVEIFEIIEKIEKKSTHLKEYGQVIQGITPYDKYRGQDPDLIKKRGYHFDHKKDKSCGKWLNGEDIGRYFQTWGGEWLSYGSWLAAPREPKFFNDERLVFREIPGRNKRIQATYVNETLYYGHSITPFILNKDAKISLFYILAIANSNLISWYGRFKLPNFGKEIFPKLNPNDIKLLPIIINSKNQKNLADKAELMVLENAKLQAIQTNFLAWTQKRFSTLTIKKNIELWYDMDWKAFDNELKKQKCQLLPKELTEWASYFEKERQKAKMIVKKLVDTDREIDGLVYHLYGLTKEEIAVIEQG